MRSKTQSSGQWKPTQETQITALANRRAYEIQREWTNWGRGQGEKSRKYCFEHEMRQDKEMGRAQARSWVDNRPCNPIVLGQIG